jgi:anthranilate phosphoribosyltransferase
MLATVFHPAMKAVIGPRKELGMRTVFNVLGPLTNPAGANAQVVGVYDPDLVPVLARALARMDVERALVVHGAGMDEICIHDETVVAEVDGDEITEYTLTPEDLGLDRAPVEAVAGGTPTENAADMTGILEGDVTGPKRDIILANAGAAIYVAGEADTLTDGVAAAREAIESGEAASKLADLQGTESTTATAEAGAD